MAKGLVQQKGITQEKEKCSPVPEDLSLQEKLHEEGISNQSPFPWGNQPLKEV